MTDKKGKQNTRIALMLRLYRAHFDKTMRDLAPEIGISPATLARVESGRWMDADTLIKIIAWMRDAEEL